MRKFTKKIILKFVKKADGRPFRTQLILSEYVRRMKGLGIDPILVTKGKHIGTKKGLNAGLAYLSILRRLHAGDYSVGPWIASKFSSKDEHQHVLNAYPDIIETLNGCPELIDKEIAAKGDSPIFKWLLDHGKINFDDPRLRNYVTKRIEWAQNKHSGGYKSRDIKFDHSKALDVLLEMKEIFEKHDKRFFLSSGTLLGAVRENGFVASDYDLDVGVFSEEIEADECAKMFEDSDFKIISIKPHLIAFIHDGSEISVEIFFHDLRHGLRHCRTDIHRWWYKPFEMIPHDFQGTEFLIPSDVTNHLNENFGNWQTPVLFYDFSYDCPNRTYSHSLESILYLYARAEKAFRGGWRYLSDNPAFALRDYFDIDYTRFIPQKVNQKAIPLPLTEFDFKDKKTVLVLGWFDSFSADQIRLLREASRRGDYLVAAVLGSGFASSTQHRSVELLERDRTNILRALACVDKVLVVENELAIDELVDRLQPSSLISMDCANAECKKIDGKFPVLHVEQNGEDASIPLAE